MSYGAFKIDVTYPPKNQHMYKIKRTIDRYPHVVMEMVNITTGERFYWALGSYQAELLCAEYHVTELKGVILDELPQNGGLFDYNDINKI